MFKRSVKGKIKSLAGQVREEFPNFLGFIIYGSFTRSRKYNDIDLICVFQKRLPEGSYVQTLDGILERPYGINQFVEENWEGKKKIDLTGYWDIYLSDHPIQILKRMYRFAIDPKHYVGSKQASSALERVMIWDKMLKYTVSESTN